jgi:hypothetical protein
MVAHDDALSLYKRILERALQGIVENGPHLPIVRQRAHEVELTLSRQAAGLLSLQSL